MSVIAHSEAPPEHVLWRGCGGVHPSTPTWQRAWPHEALVLRILMPDRWKGEGDFGWRYRCAGYAMWLWGGVTLEDTAEGRRVSHGSLRSSSTRTATPARDSRSVM